MLYTVFNFRLISHAVPFLSVLAVFRIGSIGSCGLLSPIPTFAPYFPFNT